MIHKFPKNFLFGVGTSSHQVEGNNFNNDWWFAENSKKRNQKFPLEKSGIAIDFWNRYEEDIDLVSELGCDIFRMSVEWSRIEPREGYFDEEAIFHYKKIFEYARSKKLKIFLTLHHFTIPLWFEEKGGFLNTKAAKYFTNYCLKTVSEYKEYVEYFATINEPEVLAYMGYSKGEWSPFQKSKIKSILALRNLHNCHINAYIELKKRFNIKLGIVTNITCLQAKDGGYFSLLIANFLQNFLINLNLGSIRNYLDFIGLNFYQTKLVSGLNISDKYEPCDEMGWYINFDSIRIILNKLKKFKLPILITENGLADEKDSLREWYLKYMLIEVCQAIVLDKVPIKGYIHWTLTDNYEWQFGFTKKFGLVAVDRTHNLRRIKRKSFALYQLICKTKNINE